MKYMQNINATEIIIAALGFLGSLAGSFGGFKLISYRVEQLEKKVEKHNGVIDRVYKLEQEQAVNVEKIAVANHRIDDLEREHEKRDSA